MERQRLPLAAIGWDFQAESLLDAIGIQPGWTCLDLGCGPAGILASLSRRVGPTGFVVGVDLDAEHLAGARALVHDARLTNVEILKRDVYRTGLPRDAFDFAYARLTSVTTARHEELLTEVLGLTRPGGLVALQCVTWTAPTCLRGIAVWGHKTGTEVFACHA